LEQTGDEDHPAEDWNQQHDSQASFKHGKACSMTSPLPILQAASSALLALSYAQTMRGSNA
jgi:hypothetical protein